MQRTIHGSYKPTYPGYGRRPTYEPSRLGSSTPTVSISRRGYDSISSSQISQSLPSNLQINKSNTSEQSTRTSSLTSIVDMYRPRSRTPSTQSYRPQPSRTFYYDYSEDFDNHTEPSLTRFAFIPPVAPVPTGAASARRTTVIVDGYDTQFQRSSDGVFSVPFELLSGGEPHCHQIELQGSKRPRRSGQQGVTSLAGSTAVPLDSPSRQCLHGHAGLGSTNDVGGFIAGLQVSGTDSKDLELTGFGHARPHRDRERHGIPKVFCSNGDVPSGLSYPVSPSPVDSDRAAHHRSGTTVHHARNEPASSTSTHHGVRSKFYSVDPGLSDLASLVQRLDKAADWDPDSLDNASAGSPSSSSNSPNLPPRGSTLNDDLDQGREQEPWFGESVARKAPEFIHGLRGHKRNIAASSINTSKLLARWDLGSSLAGGQSETTVFAPQPRSPAMRLRLQNSLPQIMKALPSLPSGSARSESYIPRISAEDIELSTRYPLLEHSMIASSTTVSTGILRYQNAETTRMSRDDGTPEQHLHAINRESGSRSALCTYPLDHAGLASPASSASGSGQTSPVSHNGKLKLRVSNGALMKPHAHSSPLTKHKSTEHQQAHVKQSAIFAVSNPFPHGVVAAMQSSKDSGGDPSQEAGHKEGIVGVKAYQDRESNSSSYNRLQEKATAPKPRSSLVLGASASDTESCVSGGSADGKPSRGLRKRFSNFRARLTESQVRLGQSESLLAVGDSPIRTDVGRHQIPGFDTSESDGHRRRPEAAGGLVDGGEVLLRRGFRERMTRWVKAAKQAVGSACTGLKKRDR